MKLGCHAVMFKDKIATDTAKILKEIYEAGFDGVEIGSRFFGTERREELQEILAKNQLELSGLHTGIPPKEWLEKENESIEKVLQAANFIKTFHYKNVILSGNTVEDNEQMLKVVRSIEKAALYCKDLGVQLHYHNHAREFENGCQMFDALVEYAPNVQFAVDIGWVHIARVNVMNVLKTYNQRISYIHLRDPKQIVGEDNEKFTELGTGVFDYPQLIEVVRNIVKSEWSIIEYEGGEPDINRYKQARRFLEYKKLI